MKQLERLQNLVDKFTQKEIGQFNRYCDYKRRKKPLTLFNLIIKHKDNPPEQLQIDIKRKKIHTNLRYTVNLTIDLILSFWDDNIEDANQIRTANKMINQALVLSSKGLLEEAAKLLEKVVGTTENTNNLELTLLASRIILGYKSAFRTTNNLQLSEDFVEYQSKIIERIPTLTEARNLYVIGLSLIGKGMETLNADEVRQLSAIRDRGKNLLENFELPIGTFVRLGNLLAILYSRFSTVDFKLAEFYYLSTIKRVKKLDDYYNHKSYYTAIIGYMMFIGDIKRKEDFDIIRKELLAAKAKTKKKNILISGILQLMGLYSCLMEYNLQKADDATNKAKEFIATHADKVNPSIVQNMGLLSFELAIIKGDLDLAEFFLEQLSELNIYQKAMKQFKLRLRLSFLLLQYERKNYLWVVNQAQSIKRLYSNILKKSIGVNLFLKLLVQLSSTISRTEKMASCTQFLQKLNAIFEQYPEHRFEFFFDTIEDWVTAKLKGYKTILEYKNALQK